MPRILSYHVSPMMLLLCAAESLAAVSAYYLAALTRFVGDPPFTGWEGLWRGVAFAAAVVLGLTAVGLYQTRQRLKIEGVLARVGVALGLSAIGLALLYFLAPVLAIGRGWFVLSFALTLMLLVMTRVAFARLVDQDLLRRRVVIYGAGKRATSLLQLRRRSDQRGFRIMAFLPVPGEESLEDPRIDREPGGLLQLAQKHQAEEIVIAMDERRRGFPIKELLDCKLAGIHVIDVLNFLERETGKVDVDLVNPSWIIFSEGFTRGSSGNLVFRLLDLAASSAVFLLAWPFMLITALAILIEDGRPIFYRQTRVGLVGEHFGLLKFRSMRKDAEQDGARWADKNDSRVTRVGELIRKLRIDELPQLLNVIMGDMRLVGPRPERPEFVHDLEQEIPYYHERHRVKPGLTGWAQLCYPYGSSHKDAIEKLKFDLYYVKNQSLVFDLMILLQTVEVVLWRKGAR